MLLLTDIPLNTEVNIYDFEKTASDSIILSIAILSGVILCVGFYLVMKYDR